MVHNNIKDDCAFPFRLCGILKLRIHIQSFSDKLDSVLNIMNTLDSTNSEALPVRYPTCYPQLHSVVLCNLKVASPCIPLVWSRALVFHQCGREPLYSISVGSMFTGTLLPPTSVGMKIPDILVRIRIRGFEPPTNESGSGSDSFLQ